jgi:2-polyprenyl-6-methoxyphenol hydroxylase-like FAD-dependent oxidoreductase
VLRQRMIDALAAAARRAGAEILTSSEGAKASVEGELTLANGERVKADLIVAADGVNSRLRDALDLVAERRYLRDGCIRVLIPSRSREEGLDTRTIEYWSGHRRLLYNPCNTEQLYLALSMPHDDEAGRSLPVDKALWTRSFPHLADLIGRIGDCGRYDRFEYIRLKRWSAGRVAVLGDAAHALPPNIGQGAGCAMMNGLSLAVYLDKFPDVERALAAWEQAERPLTDHSQRISRLYGMPTFWPAPLRRMFYSLAGRSRWLTEQRTRTARHIPTGTEIGDRP